VLRVAISAPLRAPFDYLPPEGLTAQSVPLGTRVRIPVGRRETVGVVVGHADAPAVPAASLRRVQELLDAEALLDPALLQLLRWTADYYHHPLGEVIGGALPVALRRGRPLLPRPPAPPRRTRRTRSRSGDAAAVTATAEHAESADPARPEAAPLAATTPPGPSPVTASSATESLSLSPEQAAAVAQLAAGAGRFGAFVLQGATGSGKTEVYLRAAAQTLESGRTVLVLVPEIALTPQLVERFHRHLPVAMSVLHSALTDAERLAAWRSAWQGHAPLVLGTRSAVFAPLPRLGLIVVDEEHDSSYKQQEGGCRYSARDLAVVRAQQSQVPIVLGSATPSLETLHNVTLGRYHALPLPRRSDQAAAPLLRLVDLRAHAVHHGLSAPVIEAMRRHLEAQRQVLVFINRRGYAPTLLCTACGWVAPCQQCDARLTVHRSRSELACHHCGAVAPLPRQCPRCGFAVKPVGQGTERVEETLQALFPDQPLLRLDRDTASRPEQLQQILQRLHSGEARILVGTQMVTKGHHFPGMMLAVVLNADQGLFSTDYRAPERLAQTIVQVAGRAGRERDRGEVLIQTEYPEHPLLQSLLTEGYEGFAAAALAERQAARWPPFGRLALLRASSTRHESAVHFLRSARAQAPEDASVGVLGPVDAAMARRAGRYYAQLLLESSERGALHRFIDAWLPQVETLARAARVRYALDVDPLEIG
jgi:primosomal protein N' (replication factor Y)